MPTVAKQLSNFTNSLPGLEKTLRLFQAIAQICAVLVVNTVHASRWGTIRSQLALGRRYLRLFKFLECFERAYAVLGQGYQAASTAQYDRADFAMTTMEVGKWSMLGMYFLLENFTILDAMGVWKTTWSLDVLIEAHKLWFYALCLSLISGLWSLFASAIEQVEKRKKRRRNRGAASEGKKENRQAEDEKGIHLSDHEDEHKRDISTDESDYDSDSSASSSSDSHSDHETNVNTEEKDRDLADIDIHDLPAVPETATPTGSAAAYASILTHLVIDSCDLLIPASVVGWTNAGQLTIGVTMLLTTVLTSRDIWAKVNAPS
ncbi:hypothetical protein VTN02DRAFT_1949 [Thermoascus thermophilus]